MQYAETDSCNGDGVYVVVSPSLDGAIRVIGLLREDGLVRGEADVKVDCERLDWWLREVSDDIDPSKSREDGDVVDFKLLRSELPKDEIPFSPLIGRLKTLTLIHTQTLLYSFNGSFPKQKKAKKMILEAGIIHQLIIIFVISLGGKLEVGNKPTREKLPWTFSQLIHGRRPAETFETRLKAVNDVPKIISVKAIAMRRRYRLVVIFELD